MNSFITSRMSTKQKPEWFCLLSLWTKTFFKFKIWNLNCWSLFEENQKRFILFDVHLLKSKLFFSKFIRQSSFVNSITIVLCYVHWKTKKGQFKTGLITIALILSFLNRLLVVVKNMCKKLWKCAKSLDT